MKREKVAYIKEFYRGSTKWIGIYINGLCNSMYEVGKDSHILQYEERLRDLRLMGYKICEWSDLV